MTDMDRKEQIRRAIVASFADVPYPGDDAIVLDPTSFAGKDIQRDLKGHHWRDLPFEAPDGCWVVFLRPEARRFYLPALLLNALDRLSEGYNPMDLFELVPPEDATRFERQHEAYTSTQKEALRLFLEYARDEAKSQETVALARLALERYWGEGRNATAELTRKEQVRQAIRQAFADVPYPGDDAIASRPEHPDGAEVIRDFKGYGWREVPRGILCYHYSSLSRFSDAALRFYLPAYLLAALECNDNIVEFTVHHLDPDLDDPDLEKWSKARFAVFRPAERHAIRLFLEYVRDEPEYGLEESARQALEEYWAKDA